MGLVEKRWAALRRMTTISLLSGALSVLFVANTTTAAPPNTMNFQGRLTNPSGAVVTDGLYNMQFRIYSVSSGGTALWTETRQTTSRVQVTNGLFSVQLGSVTPLTPSMFDAADLYFEITMATPATATCSTAGCATWESPMTPRNKLATSAYAFNATRLNGKTDTDFAAATGSANYIQNTTTAQAANFNVTGSGTIGSTLTVGGAATINNTALLKTTSSTALTIQNASSTNLLVANTSANTITIGSGANTITFGANGITLAGTARNATTVTLAPEYAGATFIGDGTNNTGSLSSDFCSGSSRQNINSASCGATETNNYYQWTTTQSTAQDYDIYVRYQIPSNYSTGTLANLSLRGWGTTTGEQATIALFHDATAAACATSGNAIAAASTWGQTVLASPLGSCAVAAGDMVTFRIRLQAGQNNVVRAGAISFNYQATR